MKLVERVLDILEAILNHGGEVGLSDLASMTGLHISSVRRFTATLTKRGYLYQKHRGGKYSLGLKLLQFSETANATINIKEQALPFLKKLCDDTSETVGLAILDGVGAINIVHVGPEHILRVVPSLLDKIPLHCTSQGKNFLAYMPDKKMDDLVDTLGLNAYTDNTITDVARLKREIETVRRDSVAFDDEEYLLGIRSAAAPIKGENGNVLATVALVVPSSRISALKMRQMAPKVKSCARKISHSLGYKGE
jgi:DNA-binding IclR family transcriptional regulator